MPIVRMAVDWGDGSPAYEVKGWFKNRKPWCDGTGNKVCQTIDTIDLNRPCQDATKDCKSGESCSTAGGADNRLHFGNFVGPSGNGACDTGYYQFTHIYTCKENGPGWNQYDAHGACRFKPKVQVLDNWGWCNGTCRDAGGGVQGCWDDSSKGAGDQECFIENVITKDKHWTSFGGAIEIKP